MNTEMHMVIFLIIMFEMVMLVFQAIYFLQRPSDKTRLQYLVLLICLIMYNVCSGLFPDKNIPIPLFIQTVAAYLVGFIMSMYVIYYFYKAFDLKHLKFFATYGLLFFLFLPFLFLFVVPFILTGDSRFSAKLTVIVPFFYGLGFLYSTARALILKFRNSGINEQQRVDPLYEHAIIAYISMACWASLPVIVFFGDFQVIEQSVTNAGFLMMTIIYVKSAIRQSRMEYDNFIQTQKGIDLLYENLETRRTTFICLAHETKTPLTLINNYLNDYINKHGENEEIRIVKNNIKRLTKDIVNFFDIESYEKGFSIYNHDNVLDFSKLLRTKYPLFESAAKGKGIDLKITIADGLMIKAHPGAIDRIVNNLIENALKYSEPSKTIDISLYSEGETVVFSVVDNGPGIPSELHGKIFDPYYKLSLNGKNYEGMGMGLSIVKRICDDIKATIVLNSSPDSGTSIHVSIPIQASDQSNASENLKLENFEDSILGVEKSSILLVEDDREMLNYLIDKLKSKYNVYSAKNGFEAMNKLAAISSLDLIISDVKMDGMDGFEFCKAVVENERYAHLPFVFLSAKGTHEDKIKGMSLGAIDYIEKPFKSEQLYLKIESILATLKKQRAAVVNKAYQNILKENNLIPKDVAIAKRKEGFTDNCNKYHLTSREVQIIKLLIKGLPYKEISSQLFISDKTVARHISNIFLKVSVNNKVELINKLDCQ